MRATSRAATIIATAVLSVGLVTGSAVSASAATSAPESTTTSEATTTANQRERRLELLCARVPNAISRIENLQERLAGDATTRGSLLWLEAKAEQARDAGREELATALENRVEVRTELAELLPQRIEALQSAQMSCDEAGL